MKITFLTFISVTSVFLFVDVIWLSQTFSYFYEPNIGDLLSEDVIIFPAALFYLIYPLGITILVVAPALNKGSLKAIFFNGFVLGFVAYGTYNLTNMATLSGWSVNVVIVDMIWGGVLTGISAVMGAYIVRKALKV